MFIDFRLQVHSIPGQNVDGRQPIDVSLFLSFLSSFSQINKHIFKN